MPRTQDLVQQAAQEIKASKTTSATPPGRSDSSGKSIGGEYIEAINQVFTLFMLNYHNQFYAAYPNDAQLNQIKKLWLDSLVHFPVEQILRGAKYAIEHSEYLPTLHRMLECCREGGDSGLPCARDAYLEACLAASPKSAQKWSHPAVYLAGRDSDWFFLASNTERASWPVFREHYERYCARALRGEALTVPAPEALDKPASKPLSVEEKQARMKKLREETGL